VRYADDMVLLARSRAEAQRASALTGIDPAVLRGIDPV